MLASTLWCCFGGLMSNKKDQNLDQGVIDGFGHEWETFDYSLSDSDVALDAQFSAYCSPLDMNIFDPNKSIVGDFGAGSGRWTSRLLEKFHKVYALEPSAGANRVLKKKFGENNRVVVLQETVGVNSIPDESLDLAVSLGVLHHIPDTALAIKDLAVKIKKNGFFLCYLYYNLENKPFYYKLIFHVINLFRKVVSKLPQRAKVAVTYIIAITIYWPLARFSKLLGRFRINVSNIPLHHYAEMPFVMLANDSLDRFGTTLEQRFSKEQIKLMLEKADFNIDTIVFSDIEPYWTFSVQKNS
jgi:SAM-dependent methyltransferase